MPVIALVGNDACWTQIAREQVPMLGSSVACDLAVSFRVITHKFKLSLNSEPSSNILLLEKYSAET